MGAVPPCIELVLPQRPPSPPGVSGMGASQGGTWVVALAFHHGVTLG